MSERVNIEDVLPDVQLHPLESGDQVLEAYVLIKTRDEDGDVGWAFRTSAKPNREELLGALMVQVQVLRNSLVAEWDVE